MSDHLGPPPVEPMSDLAWGRIERGLWAKLDQTPPAPPIAPPRTRPWRWIAIPLVAAAALVLYVETRDDSATSPVESEPSRVVAGTTPSTISFADAHITLDAASAIEMRHEGPKPIALLERGAAWFAVAPRQARPAFVVRAGDTTVRVVGTRFRVARQEERVDVEVEHGTVEITHHGALLQITSGQTWSSERPNTVGSRVVAVIPTSVEIEPKPAPKKHSRPVDSSTSAKTRAKIAPSVTPPFVTPPPAPAIDERAIYERLAAMEARDPDNALTGYLELAAGKSRWSELALFAAGRLAADRHDARARPILTDYMRRFPSGANIDDARELLARQKEEP